MRLSWATPLLLLVAHGVILGANSEDNEVAGKKKLSNGVHRRHPGERFRRRPHIHLFHINKSQDHENTDTQVQPKHDLAHDLARLGQDLLLNPGHVIDDLIQIGDDLVRSNLTHDIVNLQRDIFFLGQGHHPGHILKDILDIGHDLLHIGEQGPPVVKENYDGETVLTVLPPASLGNSDTVQSLILENAEDSFDAPIEVLNTDQVHSLGDISKNLVKPQPTGVDIIFENQNVIIAPLEDLNSSNRLEVSGFGNPNNIIKLDSSATPKTDLAWETPSDTDIAAPLAGLTTNDPKEVPLLGNYNKDLMKLAPSATSKVDPSFETSIDAPLEILKTIDLAEMPNFDNPNGDLMKLDPSAPSIADPSFEIPIDASFVTPLEILGNIYPTEASNLVNPNEDLMKLETPLEVLTTIGPSEVPNLDNLNEDPMKLDPIATSNTDPSFQTPSDTNSTPLLEVLTAIDSTAVNNLENPTSKADPSFKTSSDAIITAPLAVSKTIDPTEMPNLDNPNEVLMKLEPIPTSNTEPSLETINDANIITRPDVLTTIEPLEVPNLDNLNEVLMKPEPIATSNTDLPLETISDANIITPLEVLSAIDSTEVPNLDIPNGDLIKLDPISNSNTDPPLETVSDANIITPLEVLSAIDPTKVFNLDNPNEVLMKPEPIATSNTDLPLETISDANIITPLEVLSAIDSTEVPNLDIPNGDLIKLDPISNSNTDPPFETVSDANIFTPLEVLSAIDPTKVFNLDNPNEVLMKLEPIPTSNTDPSLETISDANIITRPDVLTTIEPLEVPNLDNLNEVLMKLEPIATSNTNPPLETISDANIITPLEVLSAIGPTEVPNLDIPNGDLMKLDPISTLNTDPSLETITDASIITPLEVLTTIGPSKVPNLDNYNEELIKLDPSATSKADHLLETPIDASAITPLEVLTTIDPTEVPNFGYYKDNLMKIDPSATTTPSFENSNRDLIKSNISDTSDNSLKSPSDTSFAAPIQVLATSNLSYIGPVAPFEAVTNDPSKVPSLGRTNDMIDPSLKYLEQTSSVPLLEILATSGPSDKSLNVPIEVLTGEPLELPSIGNVDKISMEPYPTTIMNQQLEALTTIGPPMMLNLGTPNEDLIKLDSSATPTTEPSLEKASDTSFVASTQVLKISEPSEVHNLGNVNGNSPNPSPTTISKTGPLLEYLGQTSYVKPFNVLAITLENIKNSSVQPDTTNNLKTDLILENPDNKNSGTTLEKDPIPGSSIEPNPIVALKTYPVLEKPVESSKPVDVLTTSDPSVKPSLENVYESFVEPKTGPLLKYLAEKNSVTPIKGATSSQSEDSVKPSPMELWKSSPLLESLNKTRLSYSPTISDILKNSPLNRQLIDQKIVDLKKVNNSAISPEASNNKKAFLSDMKPDLVYNHSELDTIFSKINLETLEQASSALKSLDFPIFIVSRRQRELENVLNSTIIQFNNVTNLMSELFSRASKSKINIYVPIINKLNSMWQTSATSVDRALLFAKLPRDSLSSMRMLSLPDLNSISLNQKMSYFQVGRATGQIQTLNETLNKLNTMIASEAVGQDLVKHGLLNVPDLPIPFLTQRSSTPLLVLKSTLDQPEVLTTLQDQINQLLTY